MCESHTKQVSTMWEHGGTHLGSRAQFTCGRLDGLGWNGMQQKSEKTLIPRPPKFGSMAWSLQAY